MCMPMVSMQLRRVSAKHGGSYTKQRYSRQVLITNLQDDIIYVIGDAMGDCTQTVVPITRCAVGTTVIGLIAIRCRCDSGYITGS